jgi:transketolase
LCARKPQRFINTGVAEANTIGYAAGIALIGFNVFVYNIVPFVLYRCYEQIRNDICYQQLPVTLIGIGCGLTYAPGGMTHYSVEDIALCRTLPNLSVISPIDPVETEAAVRFAATADTPVYIRIAKVGEPTFTKDKNLDILKPRVVRQGGNVAILSYGSVFAEAAEACDRLAQSKIFPRLISVPTLQPFPGAELWKLIEDCQAVITLEEHFAFGGLATMVTELLAGRRNAPRLKRLFLPNAFIHDVRKQSSLRELYGLNAQSVIASVHAMC